MSEDTSSDDEDGDDDELDDDDYVKVDDLKQEVCHSYVCGYANSMTGKYKI